ncbi:unnamed protein product [Periconia digitata]|uniref:Uncharacterized protein n=1 Tax=Periconia digitata TaxID=1303443 RepID=A0A9W4XMT8_9PLEO|nr:unnamed protein product [Periconia digitata]
MKGKGNCGESMANKQANVLDSIIVDPRHTTASTHVTICMTCTMSRDEVRRSLRANWNFEDDKTRHCDSPDRTWL